MENKTLDAPGIPERRVLSRIDTLLRINYQTITRQQALQDPYAAGFALPRYFLMLAELDQLNMVLQRYDKELQAEAPLVARVLSLLNEKIELIGGGIYDTLVDAVLPPLRQVNLSETGLSFLTPEAMEPGSHLHLTLSHPQHVFHLAVTARVVYSNEVATGSYKTGAYFINLHPLDREKLATAVASRLQQEQLLETGTLSDTGQPAS